jgi:hypothetical protein
MIPLPRPPVGSLALLVAELVGMLSFLACLGALWAAVTAPGASSPWTSFALQIACAGLCLVLSAWARSRWRALLGT